MIVLLYRCLIKRPAQSSILDLPFKYEKGLRTHTAWRYREVGQRPFVDKLKGILVHETDWLCREQLLSCLVRYRHTVHSRHDANDGVDRGCQVGGRTLRLWPEGSAHWATDLILGRVIWYFWPYWSVARLFVGTALYPGGARFCNVAEVRRRQQGLCVSVYNGIGCSDALAVGSFQPFNAAKAHIVCATGPLLRFHGSKQSLLGHFSQAFRLRHNVFIASCRPCFRTFVLPELICACKGVLAIPTILETTTV